MKKIINILALNVALLSVQLCGTEFGSEFERELGDKLFQSEAKHPVVRAYQTIAYVINLLRNSARNQEQHWNETIDRNVQFAQGLINPNLIAETKQKMQAMIARGYEDKLKTILYQIIKEDQNQSAKTQIIKDYYISQFGNAIPREDILTTGAYLEVSDEFNQSHTELLNAVNSVRTHPLFIERQQRAEELSHIP